MKKARFTKSQIVSILKSADSGMKVNEICRQNDQNESSNVAYYNWKSKYGGMDATDIKRLKELEEEYTRLKWLFAEISLENHVMKKLFTKKDW